MPIKRSSSKPALKSNIRTNMKEIGKSPHIKSKAQALAVAFSEQKQAKKKGK